MRLLLESRLPHVSRRDKPFSSITWRHWMMPMFVYWWREGFINATGLILSLRTSWTNEASSPFETFLRAYVCHPRTFWKKVQTLQTKNVQIKTILQDHTSEISRSVGVFPNTTILKKGLLTTRSRLLSQPLPIVLLQLCYQVFLFIVNWTFILSGYLPLRSKKVI